MGILNLLYSRDCDAWYYSNKEESGEVDSDFDGDPSNPSDIDNWHFLFNSSECEAFLSKIIEYLLNVDLNDELHKSQYFVAEFSEEPFPDSLKLEFVEINEFGEYVYSAEFLGSKQIFEFCDFFGTLFDETPEVIYFIIKKRQ